MAARRYNRPMAQTIEIPIFPLGTVLFPDGRLPLRIFEQRYVDMTKACIGNDTVFGVCLIKGGFEVGAPAIPCEIGCTARIDEWAVPSPGLFNIVASGESVFRIIERRATTAGLIVATVELRDRPEPMAVPERHAPLLALLKRAIDANGKAHFSQAARFDDAAWVCHRLAEGLPVLPERRQAWLELGEPVRVLDEITETLKSLR